MAPENNELTLHSERMTSHIAKRLAHSAFNDSGVGPKRPSSGGARPGCLMHRRRAIAPCRGILRIWGLFARISSATLLVGVDAPEPYKWVIADKCASLGSCDNGKFRQVTVARHGAYYTRAALSNIQHSPFVVESLYAKVILSKPIFQAISQVESPDLAMFSTILGDVDCGAFGTITRRRDESWMEK